MFTALHWVKNFVL